MRGLGHPSSTVPVIALSTTLAAIFTVHCLCAPVALLVLANRQRFPQGD